MRRVAAAVGLVLLGVGLGWVLHAPKHGPAAPPPPAPETLAVIRSDPRGPVEETHLRVLTTLAADGRSPARWQAVPVGAARTWVITLDYGDRRAVWTAREE